jgi:hypothetical protein
VGYSGGLGISFRRAKGTKWKKIKKWIESGFGLYGSSFPKESHTIFKMVKTNFKTGRDLNKF